MGFLARVVAKLVRLDHLVRMPDASADAAARVFQGDLLAWRIQKGPYKLQGIFRLLGPALNTLVPMKASMYREGGQ